jgi:hypothetical protein
VAAAAVVVEPDPASSDQPGAPEGGGIYGIRTRDDKHEILFTINVGQ